MFQLTHFMSVLIVIMTRTAARGSKFPEESLNLLADGNGCTCRIIKTNVDGKGSMLILENRASAQSPHDHQCMQKVAMQ